MGIRENKRKSEVKLPQNARVKSGTLVKNAAVVLVSNSPCQKAGAGLSVI